jgi:hypothetical protein
VLLWDLLRFVGWGLPHPIPSCGLSWSPRLKAASASISNTQIFPLILMK